MAVKSTSLISLATALANLGITADGGANDAIVEGAIDDATDLVEEYCGRSFSRAAVVAEKAAGYSGSPFLVIDRPPINDALITDLTITVLGASVDLTDGYEIEDREAGLIRSDYGWGESSFSIGRIAIGRQPGTERKAYAVTYDGGFVTEVQAAESGGTYEGETVTLPGPIKRAMLEIVGLWAAQTGRNPNLTSERIGPAAETYSSNGVLSIPKSAEALLDRYTLAEV